MRLNLALVRVDRSRQTVWISVVPSVLRPVTDDAEEVAFTILPPL
jgi:hypothetical protein